MSNNKAFIIIMNIYVLPEAVYIYTNRKCYFNILKYSQMTVWGVKLLHIYSEVKQVFI